MKSFILIAGLVFTALFVQAQEGKWRIKMNGKTLLYTSTENEKLNTRKISSAEWKKSGYLEIIFTEADPTMWYRSFQFDDEKGEQLFAADSTTKVRISLAKLRKLFAGKKELIIYTVIAPRNPDMAIRIRRVHLCTLKLR